MNTKTIILVVVTLGIIGLILWFMRQEKKQTGLMLQIIDNKTGKTLEAHSPVDLLEGGSYTIRAKVTNTSTKAGVGVNAHLATNLVLSYTDAGGATRLINSKTDDVFYIAGAARVIDLVVTIPSDAAGRYGEAIAVVTSMDVNQELARKTIPTKYIAAPFVYGVSLEWAVI